MKSYFFKISILALVWLSFVGTALSYTVPVEWESDGDRYVLEVKDPQSKITQYKTKKSKFEIPIPEAGKYRWRVKSIKWGTTSAFSEWGTINVKDGIKNFAKVLMSSPKDQTEVDLNTQSPEIKFSYELPVPSWKYSIEILEDEKQVVDAKVEKDTFQHTISDTSREVKWRVTGINNKGQKTKNLDFWTLNVLSPRHEKASGQWFYDFYISQYAISQTFSNDVLDGRSSSESFLLQGHGLGYRYLAQRRRFHSAEAILHYSLPLQFSDEISMINLNARARFNVFGGKGRILTEFDYTRLTYRLFQQYDALQNFTFLSLGYESTLNFLGPKYTGALLLRGSFIPLDSLPGLRARLVYDWKTNIKLNIEGDYTKNKPTFKVNGSSGKTETTQMQMKLGFSYLF